MTQDWTKEPWVYSEMAFAEIEGPDFQLIASADTMSDDTETDEANARRIVSCVNAMQGIPDPAAFVAAFEGMERFIEQLTEEYGIGAAATAALTAARAAEGGEA